MLRLITLFLAFTLFASALEAAERPNVVIVMTDDQGMGDFHSRAIQS